MDRDRSRVLGLLVVYLALVVVALFVLDWFVAVTPFGKLTVGLRSALMCPEDGTGCASFSLAELTGTGTYAPLAGLTFFGTLLFSLLVGYQAIKRIGSGGASESMSKLGYLAGMALFATAASAGFLFGPQATEMEKSKLGVEVVRTSAPFLLLIGLLVGITVLYYAVTQTSTDEAQYKPIAKQPERKQSQPLPVAAVVKKHESAPPASAIVVVEKKRTTPPGSAPISTVPEHLRKKLKFVVLSAEVTRAGINARCEDGSSKLVLWRDVVGLVARRMPTDYDGLTFLDVVSTAGSTLRILPWTRMTGNSVDADGDEWSRAVLNAMLEHCPAASLDPATKRFHGGELAAQLPDLKKLDAHDAKLA
jgi:hypothetical protein